jgi:hypothetical protein
MADFPEFARFMELVRRARRVMHQSKGAPPDPATEAEMRTIAHDAIDLIPGGLRGLVDQFKQAASHARRAVEMLAESPPNVREAQAQLCGAAGRVGGGIGNTILPAVAGNSNLSRRDLVELLQASSQVLKEAKDLTGKLSAEPLDLSTIRERAAALSGALQALAARADVAERRQDQR